MQEADITSLFRTLAIIFIIYYGLKLFSKYVAPILLKRAATKFEERVKNQQQPAEPRGDVGGTIVEKKPGSKKDSGNDFGEYVDYEEVE